MPPRAAGDWVCSLCVDLALVTHFTLSTTGGSGGTTVTVATLADLKTAVTGEDKKIVIISGTVSHLSWYSQCLDHFRHYYWKRGCEDRLQQDYSWQIRRKCVLVLPCYCFILRFASALNGVSIRVLEVKNVIIRNLKIFKVIADAGDAIGVQEASQVWIDHVDLSSNQDHDKDYYDGLFDITHGSYGVSVT
jgi:pectate lyase